MRLQSATEWTAQQQQQQQQQQKQLQQRPTTAGLPIAGTPEQSRKRVAAIKQPALIAHVLAINNAVTSERVGQRAATSGQPNDLHLSLHRPHSADAAGNGRRRVYVNRQMHDQNRPAWMTDYISRVNNASTSAGSSDGSNRTCSTPPTQRSVRPTTMNGNSNHLTSVRANQPPSGDRSMTIEPAVTSQRNVMEGIHCACCSRLNQQHNSKADEGCQTTNRASAGREHYMANKAAAGTSAKSDNNHRTFADHNLSYRPKILTRSAGEDRNRSKPVATTMAGAAAQSKYLNAAKGRRQSLSNDGRQKSGQPKQQTRPQPSKNFLQLNIESAKHASLKRSQSSDNLKWSHPPGSLPVYFIRRQQQQQEQEQQQRAANGTPMGYSRLSDSARLNTLQQLRNAERALLDEWHKLPLTVDHRPSIRHRKQAWQTEMHRVDQAIAEFSKPVVFVKNNDDNNRETEGEQ